VDGEAIGISLFRKSHRLVVGSGCSEIPLMVPSRRSRWPANGSFDLNSGAGAGLFNALYIPLSQLQNPPRVGFSSFKR
jgi:hypothetical protein